MEVNPPRSPTFPWCNKETLAFLFPKVCSCLEWGISFGTGDPLDGRSGPSGTWWLHCSYPLFCSRYLLLDVQTHEGIIPPRGNFLWNNNGVLSSCSLLLWFSGAFSGTSAMLTETPAWTPGCRGRFFCSPLLLYGFKESDLESTFLLTAMSGL